MGFEHELWVDRGGTFTDCVLVESATRRVRTHKLLSTDDAPVRALRILLGLADDTPPPPVDLRLGTTLGTNALLERRGSAVALVTDRGLGDLVAIRDQARPELFARTVTRERPLPAAVIEVDVRIDARGVVHGALDADALLARLARARAEGCRALAIALRFSPLAPALEDTLAALGRRAGFDTVVCSHRTVPEPGHLARLETTVVDAYLTPVLRDYLDRLARELPGSRIRVMQSDGTLASAARFRGRDAALSGPAGGLVGAASVAASLGGLPMLAFDMGGTSTDVSRVEAAPEPSPEGRVAGLRIRAPMLAVHTVAAGGGSLCRLDVGRLVVGPESAGAFPGPLCYGRAEAQALALTDVALVLGRIVPAHFPFALDLERPRDALRAMAGTFGEPEQLAQAFFDVAVATMARALADVSIARGHDPREHGLVVFGGAGGQYACAVARTLGLRTLVFHPLAGLLSAYGIGIASLGGHREAPLVARDLDEAIARAAPIAEQLAQALGEELAGEGAESLAIEPRLVLRYARTETSLEVPLGGDAAEARAAFEAAHRRIFGIVRDASAIEAIAVRVHLRSPRVPPSIALDADAETGGTTRLFVDGRFLDVPLVRRGAAGARWTGPAVILEPGGTIVVEPGFEAELRDDGAWLLTDRAAAPAPPRSTARDPVRLEVLGHLVASIATRMGEVLQKTATSPNVRDRLDYSCAVFDAEGGLVANAPHIPVHLGAMGDSVRAVAAAHRGDLRAGDVYVTNDPTTGGSHLPDVTVVAPVFDAAGALRAFVANRGHHADVGGIVPGSMPSFSSRLDEEGVVLGALRVVRDGIFDEAAVRRALSAGPHPARRVGDNVRDLEAQLASARAGIELLDDAFARHGADVVVAYFGHLHASAEERVRAALRALPFRGERRFEDALDDGTRIALTLRLDDEGTLEVDFTGTSGPHPGNANAPRSVVKSAVLYVLRLLVGRPMPLNEGCLRAVVLRLPEPSLVAPPPGAAVSSGNVETSQRIVDVLLGALGLAAASQGTMNNVAVGNARFAFYETLGGGAGATDEGPGASAVHVHMTNSRLTDVEVIESCFPVRIVETSIRRGSGGEGLHRGGEGLVREIEFLEPVTASIVSERRVRSPWGLAGGGAGSPGRNTIDGEARPGRFEATLAAGARLRIETPGGGGWGVAREGAEPPLD